MGSREIPNNITELIKELSERLARREWVLRSGAAEGADTAFEYGCDYAGGEKEIFLPWSNFNGSRSQFNEPSEMAIHIAEKYHPSWKYLKGWAKKLMARDVHQVLGEDCQTPVEFVVCWTLDGSEGKTTKVTGGTGQAIRLAFDLGIPVFNLKNDGAHERLVDFLNNFKDNT